MTSSEATTTAIDEQLKERVDHATDVVIKAYEQTGDTPVPFVRRPCVKAGHRDDGRCAVGVVEHANPELGDREIEKLLGIEPQTFVQFEMGFDRGIQGKKPYATDLRPSYLIGYEVGRRIRELWDWKQQLEQQPAPLPEPELAGAKS